MLGKVVIENYRSCVHTVIDLHPRISVLIGPNGSGKTNILQGLMLLNKLTLEERIRAPEPDSPGAINSLIRATFEESKVILTLSALIAAYTNQSNNDVIRGSRQRWRVRGKNKERASFEMPLAFLSRQVSLFDSVAQDRLHLWSMHNRRYSLRSKIPEWGWNAVARVADYCRGMTYYGASQFTNPGTCPASFEMDQEGSRAVFRLRGHAKILYAMYSARKSRNNNNYEQFMELVGPRGLRLIDDLTFREVETSSSDYSVRVGGKVEVRKRNKLLVIPQFRIGRQRLSPNQLSEGTFKTLALLFHIINDESTVLLIEEPEVCVHHGLLSSILELIKSASRQKQMILSTHSDFVLDHVDPDNVYRVGLDKPDGTIVHHIRKTMTAKEYTALRSYLNSGGQSRRLLARGGLERP